MLNYGVDVNLVDGDGFIVFYNVYINFYLFFGDEWISFVIVKLLFEFGSKVDNIDLCGWIELYMVVECLLVKFVE